NVHPKGSLSTRIESHIPGTQAHREREYLEHEDRTTFGRNHPVPPMNAPPVGTNTAAANPMMNTTVPNTGGYGTGTGGYTGTTGPTVGGHGGHGATMRERAAELQGRGHGGIGTTAAATGTHTGAPKAHMGDRIMGGIEAAIGRATNNPVTEQKGWERKTFGDPKHRQANANLAAQQAYGPTGQPAQQAFTNPQPGYTAPTQPPRPY
ncbi:10088_t:CDS:2, partial [Acaulospora colombiana]